MAGYNSALSHPRESHSPASGDQEGLQHSGCQENSEEGRQGGQEARRQEARREIRRQQVQRQAGRRQERSEEHTSELQSLMRTSYAVFCLKTKKLQHETTPTYP